MKKGYIDRICILGQDVDNLAREAPISSRMLKLQLLLTDAPGIAVGITGNATEDDIRRILD